MNTQKANLYPLFRPVADHGLLAEFGDSVDAAIHEQVLRLDRTLADRPFSGFCEALPAYASLLVLFDPMVTDHAAVQSELESRIATGASTAGPGRLHEIPVCYDEEFAPDIGSVSTATGLAEEAVIHAHLAGDYRVYMYGFAPGYAYLAGVPEAIRLPRKDAPLRGIAAGSVIIAGPQCLITTLTMPTGWWIIGRSPTQILNPHSIERPFLFDVGDRVKFRRISRNQFDQESRG